VSKKELCQIIQRQVPDFMFIDAPIGKDPDQRNYVVSNAKIDIILDMSISSQRELEMNQHSEKLCFVRFLRL
ncbi:MAG: hypothetical protein EBT45_05520, partial [Alphaproteobacteria bacterium]|nr:hypothetical protein [Alphaproteobacteria bacterium]